MNMPLSIRHVSGACRLHGNHASTRTTPWTMVPMHITALRLKDTRGIIASPAASSQPQEERKPNINPAGSRMWCMQEDAQRAAPAPSIGSAARIWTMVHIAVKVVALACVAIAIAQLSPSPAAASAVSTASSNPIRAMFSFILHLDHHLSAIITEHGHMVYGILFGIVFCETGLVLTPFLPGDSLLFAAGAYAGMGKLDAKVLLAIFISSAILGDMVNYAMGNNLGRWAMDKGLIRGEYIEKTEKFYAKHGGKTVVLARFVPIIRTFAPFVAGVGSMPYGQFAQYNVVGAVVWSLIFVGLGFFFGNLPFVQKNFTTVVLGIVAISVVPICLEIVAAKKEAQEQQQQQQQQGGADGGAAST